MKPTPKGWKVWDRDPDPGFTDYTYVWHPSFGNGEEACLEFKDCLDLPYHLVRRLLDQHYPEGGDLEEVRDFLLHVEEMSREDFKPAINELSLLHTQAMNAVRSGFEDKVLDPRMHKIWREARI